MMTDLQFSLYFKRFYSREFFLCRKWVYNVDSVCVIIHSDQHNNSPGGHCITHSYNCGIFKEVPVRTHQISCLSDVGFKIRVHCLWCG